MRDATEFKVPKLPFVLGDVFFLGLAGFIWFQGRPLLSRWDLAALAVCVGLGALLGVLPYLLEYRALLKRLEVNALGAVAEKIQNFEALAAQITGATDQWEMAQEQADKTAATAKEIAERMAAEVKEFTEFMRKMNESEKAALRLEVEKLRRGEAEWLQVLVRVLDHVFALHSAAARSSQPHLAEQLSHFQNACRDAARRVGLTPFIAEPAEPFDPQRHQLEDNDSPAAGAVVAETIATGYTFQGQFLRPALVRVQNGKASPPSESTAAPAAPQNGQNQLPLDPAESKPV
jgi:molecular chaperone GrpE (heat shock protein)